MISETEKQHNSDCPTDGTPASVDKTKSTSDLKRAFSEDGPLKTHVGGQALIEGIMMRGKYNWAVAVRTPDGDIYVEEHDLTSGKDKHSWMKWPLVRGVVALVESMALGFKALEIAAQHAFGDDEAAEKSQAEANELVDAMEAEFEPNGDLDICRDDCNIASLDENNHHDETGLGKGMMTLSMVCGVLLGVGAFLVLPAFVTNLIVGDYESNIVLWNVVDGIFRVAIFISYIWLIGRMEDIRRMFMYHGAEHKTIHCYEHGLELTPENAMSFPRLHVRCGTAFLIMVLILAIVIYTIVPVSAIISALGIDNSALKFALILVVRILFVPIIAGVAYEVTVKWAGSHPENPLVKLILWPGMQMQYLTTNEPDAGTIECAIAAMQRILDREEAEGKTS